VVLAAALAGVTVLIAAGLAWTARLVYIGNLDAHDLADKGGAELTLRRRQGLQRVHAVLVAEDTAPSW
jgi:hypothetical protein